MSRPPHSQAAMDQLISTLDLEKLEENLFRGVSPQVGWQRVFGGQVIAQALMAAQRTVEDDRFVHSLHAYFMRPGDPTVPIVYQEGLDHQAPIPPVTQPEKLMGEKEFKELFLAQAPAAVRKYWNNDRPIEVRPVSLVHYLTKEKLEPRQDIWVRAVGDVPAHRHYQACVLAYLSDMTLLDTSLYPHGTSIFDPKLQVASLDHAMWFHRPCNLDDWLLYTQDSPSSSGARGMTRGALYTRSGTLVASVAQEGLIRKRADE